MCASPHARLHPPTAHSVCQKDAGNICKGDSGYGKGFALQEIYAVLPHRVLRRRRAGDKAAKLGREQAFVGGGRGGGLGG